MGTTELAADRDGYRTATFGRIVCGINGSRADAEAVRQAALLSGSEGKLEIVCVLETRGYGATGQANISPARAETAMEHARERAREAGVTPSTSIVHGTSPWESLAQAAEGADLIVVGSHGGSRAGGIVLGSVASAAVHRAELPVLVARPSPGAPFPEKILLASDGTPASHAAADLAATVARVHGSEITLFTADGDETPARRHELAAQEAHIALATGREPVVVMARGHARKAIVEHALSELPSLVIIGSRGTGGLRALGSVSEHVTHDVPSSVMVARPSHPEVQR